MVTFYRQKFQKSGWNWAVRTGQFKFIIVFFSILKTPCHLPLQEQACFPAKCKFHGEPLPTLCFSDLKHAVSSAEETKVGPALPILVM